MASDIKRPVKFNVKIYVHIHIYNVIKTPIGPTDKLKIKILNNLTGHARTLA